MTIGDTFLEHTANQTITYSGNFRFCFTSPLLSALTRTDCPYTIIFVVMDLTYVEQFLVGK